MRTRGGVLTPILFAAIVFAANSPAGAQVTYSYQGQQYTTADPPYSTSDRVNGSFETAAPLPALQPLTDISGLLADFSFADGVQVRTPANSTVCSFQVATDAAGNIVQWIVDLRQAPTPTLGNPQEVLISSAFLGDLVGVQPAAATACAPGVLSPAASSPTPGSWTDTLPPGAPTTYSYLGQPFTAADPPYTTADRVTGSILLADPLPPLMSLSEIGFALADFSFADGVQTRTPANSTVCSFKIATDAAGNIVQWVVDLRLAPTPALGNPQEVLISSSFGIDLVGIQPAGTTACAPGVLTTAASSTTPGSWTDTLPPGAPTTYNYLCRLFIAANPPYTTANRVTGSILLADPLPPLMPLTEIGFALADFSFTDGVQTRTPSNTTICVFQVATDAAGDIVQWIVALRQAPTPTPGNPQQVLDSSSFSKDQVGVGPAGTAACAPLVLNTVASSSGPGTWTRLRSIVEIPTLTSAALAVLAGLLAIAAGAVLRRRA